MNEQHLKTLCDLTTEAHTSIQKNHATIDPVVGVNQGMRKIGIPADIMTIDCLKTGKRIIVVLNDDKPHAVQYQFSYKDKDPAEKFEVLDFNELTATVIYNWMEVYFSQK